MQFSVLSVLHRVCYKAFQEYVNFGAKNIGTIQVEEIVCTLCLESQPFSSQVKFNQREIRNEDTNITSMKANNQQVPPSLCVKGYFSERSLAQNGHQNSKDSMRRLSSYTIICQVNKGISFMATGRTKYHSQLDIWIISVLNVDSCQSRNTKNT